MDANEKKISERVIGCAYIVANELGAGFLEAVYERALALEMRGQGLAYERQKLLQVLYKGSIVGHYVADFVVEDVLIVEIKALAQITSQHEAQAMNYLRATGLSVALLLNFGTPRVGVKRVVAAHDDNKPI